jgi:hypothetical protein
MDKKYMIGNSELPTNVLLEYPHTIKGDEGRILVGLKVGQRVIKYPTQIHANRNLLGEEKTITEFVVFGGVICARFEGSNAPHWIDCIRPLVFDTPSV